MKKNGLLLLLICMMGLSVFLFISLYQEAKREAIRHLNVQQSLLAVQAARGIEDYFADWTGILTVLSEMNHIVSLDQTGRETINGSRKIRETLST